MRVCVGRESGGIQMKKIKEGEENKTESKNEEELVMSAILAIKRMGEADLSQV